MRMHAAHTDTRASIKWLSSISITSKERALRRAPPHTETHSARCPVPLQFLRDLVSKNVTILKHMAGKTMFADLLTKAISRQLFDILRSVMDNYMSTGVATLPERE